MPKIIHRLPTKSEVEFKGQLGEQKPADRIISYVTFFGDSSITEDSDIYKSVYTAAKLLAENGYGVVNGGGPGVMMAATAGAEAVNGRTKAIYWQPQLASIFEGKNLTNITDKSETYSNYIMRTLGLIEEGQVFIVCKGGTGTISEFGLVWALAKLYYGKHKPVILYGNFWKEIIDIVQKNMLIDDNELGVLTYANTPEEILELVQGFELEVEARTHKTYAGDETAFVLAPRFDAEYQDYILKAKKQHTYRVSNAVTKRQLEEFKSLVAAPARVLEIGCGAGYDLSFLTENYSVTAIDNDPEVLEIARFENPNADIIEMSVQQYEVQENTFKGIWARDVMHFLAAEEVEPVMQKLVRGLVPGGILYIIVREGEGEGMEEDMHAGKPIQRRYKYFTEDEMRGIADRLGAEVVKVDHVERSHKWLSVILRKR